VARKGSFGTDLTPFGESESDLSVYQIGTGSTPQATQTTPTQTWYSAAPPPEAPTTAPPAGVLPDPVIPEPKIVDYVAAAAKMQNYVNILQAVPNRTAAQEAALKVDLAQLAYNQAQISPADAARAQYLAMRELMGVPIRG
jgi:hypothetical protein